MKGLGFPTHLRTFIQAEITRVRLLIGPSHFDKNRKNLQSSHSTVDFSGRLGLPLIKRDFEMALRRYPHFFLYLALI